MSAKNYITPDGLEKLKVELRKLRDDERPKLLETIAWAASNGDRSENADYIYGKKRLREIEKRLRFLMKRLEMAEVVDPTTITTEKVTFGAVVTICDEDGEETTYQIVGEDEIDTKSKRISWKSPLAKALLGKKQGDAVTVHRPAGAIEVEIVLIKLPNS
ncbi:MAG: transcription elongation factor GreB [Deltaproteobacteria bacterium CG11_big_fil_rev_8_21_14_0_20_47_16]|nr:MAG: transcription elongation factor GreB [Deltaproteobacteria bacterium CG11_big_fil_rev_8_21_14_0_20_47_16]